MYLTRPRRLLRVTLARRVPHGAVRSAATRGMSMPEQVLTGRAVAFDPATHGFAFPNAFVNQVLTLPNGATITTAGRCGGMAHAGLDYFLASQAVPPWRSYLWTPRRVPPGSHWLARAAARLRRGSVFTRCAPTAGH